MAWRSSGTNNDEMINNLKRFGVIHSPSVEAGFRAVDRRFFVPRIRQEVAHSDQPLKEGNIHISAPHIYGSVVEALELTPNTGMSFLNIGSGTGYLSCIVAEILGPTSTHYGIELYADVVEHCQEAIMAWKATRPNTSALAHIDILHGNGLQIDSRQGESNVGLDRIYIGAAVERRELNQLVALLKPGGILVGPVDDELVKVVRIGNSEVLNRPPSPPRSLRGQPPPLSADFSQQVISGVRFAPLLPHPSIPTVLPSRVWSPDLHSSYPESFRKSAKTILLCSRAQAIQPPPNNASAALPRALWMEILSYTRRDWFEPRHSEEAFLRERLREERAASQRAHEARMEAEARLHVLERERDVYRLLALRWQRRLQAVTRERDTANAGANANDDDLLSGLEDIAASAVFGNEPLVVSLGLGSLIRRFQRDTDDEESLDEDEDATDEHADMEDDTQMSEEEGETMEDVTVAVDVEPMSVSPTGSSELVVRSQVRTVSISSEDL